MARSKNMNVSASWTAPETLSESQLWCVKSGSIAVALGEGTPDAEDGIPLNAGDVMFLLSGEIVRYRRISAAPAHLQREPKE